MKILLISGQSGHELSPASLKEWTDYLSDALKGNAKIYATFLDKLLFDFSDDRIAMTVPELGLDASDVDYVFIRGPYLRDNSAYTYCVSRFCELNSIPCANDYSAFFPGNKVAQATVFKELKASIPRTIYSIDKLVMVKRANDIFGFPFILKTNTGSHGDYNYLVRSDDELQKILTENTDIDFLAQAYCPNDRDYRILFVGDSHLVFERRGSADSHLNNTSKGGVALKVNDAIPDEIILKAKEVSERLNFTISGVDVMPNLNTGEFVFLEINSQPQLRTGALLDEKKDLLVDLFLKEI